MRQRSPMRPAARCRCRKKSRACFRPARRLQFCSIRLRPICCSAGPAPTGRKSALYMLPDICTRAEVGRITGRGNTANLESVIALKPDLILDVGSTSSTFVSLAERVQQQTGIPYALLDGRFDAVAETYRKLGELTGRQERGRKARALRRRHDQDHCRPYRGDRAFRSPARLLRARAARAGHRARRLDQRRDD